MQGTITYDSMTSTNEAFDSILELQQALPTRILSITQATIGHSKQE